MRLPRMALLILLFLLGASVALGQMHSYGTRGTVEIGGSVSFSSVTDVSAGDTGPATSFLVFSPRFGYFPVEGLEIGLNPGLSHLEVPPGISVVAREGRTSTTMMQLFAFGAYNFRLEGSPVVPFFEVPFGYTMINGSTDRGGFSWGVRGGIKIVPVDHLLLSIAAEYWQLAFTESGETERSGANIIMIGVGVGGFF